VRDEVPSDASESVEKQPGELSSETTRAKRISLICDGIEMPAAL
jgi:hypothetical protein